MTFIKWMFSPIAYSPTISNLNAVIVTVFLFLMISLSFVPFLRNLRVFKFYSEAGKIVKRSNCFDLVTIPMNCLRNFSIKQLNGLIHATTSGPKISVPLFNSPFYIHKATIKMDKVKSSVEITTTVNCSVKIGDCDKQQEIFMMPGKRQLVEFETVTAPIFILITAKEQAKITDKGIQYVLSEKPQLMALVDYQYSRDRDANIEIKEQTESVRSLPEIEASSSKDDISNICIRTFLFAFCQYSFNWFELLDIYGTQSSTTSLSENGEMCVVCISEECNVIVLPCRHSCMCVNCLRGDEEDDSGLEVENSELEKKGKPTQKKLFYKEFGNKDQIKWQVCPICRANIEGWIETNKIINL